MSKPEARDVLGIIVEIAQSIKCWGPMLNERYLHHYFSHLLQARYNLLNLTKERGPIRLHPEWPTYKKSTQLDFGKYKKKQKKYMPIKGGRRPAGFIDFAIGDYERPDIGIEFSLKDSWATEEVVFDFLKMLDKRNPFNAAFSFNIVFRLKRLTKGKYLERLENKMNDAYKEAVRRLGSNVVDDSRDIHFIVSEIAKDNRRHWHFDKTKNRFKRSLPIPK